MLLPYRAKNPPERFPWFTIGLICTNILVYALTTEFYLSVHETVLDQWAISRNQFNPIRLIGHMFLHGSLMHLIGNMLFLYIFGSAVEGRLGPAKFLATYFAAGTVGALLENYVAGAAFPNRWVIGASGAIMGLAGAYLWMFPFATVCVAWMWGFRGRLMEWQAQWVILYFLAYDVLYGMLQGLDGVAHFAHLGGAAGGFLIPMLLRERRDSEEASEAQAMRADAGGNYLALNLHELEALIEANPNNVGMIMAFCKKAATRVDGTGYRLALEMLEKHQDILIREGETAILGPVVLGLPESVGSLPQSFYLRFGGKLEIDGMNEWAIRAYRRVYTIKQDSPDTEMALVRLAKLTERVNPDKGQAAAVWAEVKRLFPNGPQAANAEAALKRLGEPTVAFSAGSGEGPAMPTPPPAGLGVVGAGGGMMPGAANMPPAPAPSGMGGIGGGMAPMIPAAASPTPGLGGIGPQASWTQSAGNAAAGGAEQPEPPPPPVGGGMTLTPVGSHRADVPPPNGL